MGMVDVQMGMLDVQMLEVVRFDVVFEMMVDQMVVEVVVEMVLDVRMRIVDDLVVDHLRLGELEDEHGGGQDHREQA